MKMDELFRQDIFEKNIKEMVSALGKKEGRVNDMLEIELVECNGAEKQITFELPVLDWELNPNSVLHGGIGASMMDLCLGILANYVCHQTGGIFAPTVNMNINYLEPVPKDSRVIIKAVMVSSGRSILVLNGEGRIKSSGKLALTASATYKSLK